MAASTPVALCRLWGRRGSLLVLLLVLTPPALAVETGSGPDPKKIIKEIRFEGNKRTRPSVMLQEMRVQVGDVADPRQIERSRQAIQDLSLFKSVKAEVIEEEDGTVLVITVEEKFYILPIPRVNLNAERDLKYGAEIRFDNLFGLNQRLKLSWLRTRFGEEDRNDKDKAEAEYSYPRISGSPYSLDFEAKQEKEQLDTVTDNNENASYMQSVESISPQISRWHRRTGPSRGLRYGGGFFWSDTNYERLSGPEGVYTDEKVVAVNAFIGYQLIHDNIYSRKGAAYGYGVSVGVPQWGSTDGFTNHRLFYRGYFPVFGTPHQNLNVQFRFGFSNHPNGAAFSVGGADSLRGYSRGELTGNAYLQLNLEYLFPVFGYSPFRLLLFTDVGNAYPGLDAVTLADLEGAVGTGFRWKIRAFVKTDLRVDYAYALGTGETRVYVGTRETF